MAVVASRFEVYLVRLDPTRGHEIRKTRPCLIISPDEPRIWVWQRTDGAFPKEPEIIEKRDQHVRLPALAIDIPVDDIYRGIT